MPVHPVAAQVVAALPQCLTCLVRGDAPHGGAGDQGERPGARSPSYQQLAALLRDRIQDGTYQPRSPVPSLHELVDQTGLSLGTVQKAIDVLKAEGLVYSVTGRGTFVTETGQP